jgi:hypothetical protein
VLLLQLPVLMCVLHIITTVFNIVSSYMLLPLLLLSGTCNMPSRCCCCRAGMPLALLLLLLLYGILDCLPRRCLPVALHAHVLLKIARVIKVHWPTHMRCGCLLLLLLLLWQCSCMLLSSLLLRGACYMPSCCCCCCRAGMPAALAVMPSSSVRGSCWVALQASCGCWGGVPAGNTHTGASCRSQLYDVVAIYNTQQI